MLQPRECPACGAPVVGRALQARYCSDKCGRSARLRRHYDAHPQKYADKRAADNADVSRRIHYRVKHRALRAGIPFDLSINDIVVPPICPVLGIPIEPHSGKSGMHYSSPSLDRINPSLGYVRGNVRVISGRANLLKSNATVAEMRAVLADLEAINSACV